MNKQEMVDRLVTYSQQIHIDDDISEGLQARAPKRLPDFARMPESRLKRELQFRGLMDFDEPERFDEEDADDFVSEDTLMALVSDSARPALENHFFD